MTPTTTELLVCPIHEKALSDPDAVALISDDYQLSYKQLDSLTSSLAVQLKNEGIGRGDIVALWLETGLEYVVLLFALFRLGGIAATINTRLHDEAITDSLTRIKCAYLISKNKPLSLEGNELFVHISLDQLFWLGDGVRRQLTEPIKADQRATIIFSSGSTAKPKAVLHSFKNHYYSALGSNQNIALVKGDRWLLSLPLYHVAGIAILFRTLIAGASIIIPNKSRSTHESLEVYKVTHASLVSTQLQRLLQHVGKGKKYPFLKALLVGGSAISDSMRDKAFKEGLPVHFSYGLSEMSSQVTTTSSQPAAQEILTSGSLLSYRSVDIDQEGEIRVKGETLFLGYLDTDVVRLPVDEEGWFHTGDLGAINQAGWLVVLGRKDNMFISGGENIYPEQVEKALGLYPGLSRVMVVSIADETFGRRPVAFIDVPDFKLFCNEIDQFLVGKLPRYMVPVRYFDWNDAPERKGIKDSRREFSSKAEQLIKERF